MVYLAVALILGDSPWLVPGHYPLPIQTSRILLYAGYFFVGVGVGAVSLRRGILAQDGALAKRWTVWLAFAFACYGAILILVYAHHNWLVDFNSPALWWHTAYGIYLLHFIFLIWLQYIVYDPAFPAFVKFAIVFTGTLSMSWALTVLLRKIPVVARTI